MNTISAQVNVMVANFKAAGPGGSAAGDTGMKNLENGLANLQKLGSLYNQGKTSDDVAVNDAYTHVQGALAQMAGPRLGAPVASQPGVWTENSGSASGTASSSSAGSLDARIQSGWDKLYSQITEIGSQIQSLEDEAMKLMGSKDAADQAKGNAMMKQAQMMFEALKNFIDAFGKMAESALRSAGSH